MRYVFAFGAFLLTAPGVFGQSIDEAEKDPYSLQLAVIDITNANRDMTVYDTNEDGVIDRTEMQRVRYRDELTKLDLNRDQKLTQLEIVVRYAALRDVAGIEQRHVTNAKAFLSRNDTNRNGQMDPEEIAEGWPAEPEAFDSNRDGIITLSEIAARIAMMEGMRRELGIQQADQVTANRTIRRHDSDQDQLLSEDEQRSAFLPLPASQFDDDNDRKLSSMEIATMLAEYRQKVGLSESDLIRIRTLFTTLDRDIDGVISAEELGSAPRQAVARGVTKGIHDLDLNHDGALTYKEVSSSLSKVRAELGFDDSHLGDARKLMVRHDRNRSQFLDRGELGEPVETLFSERTFDAMDTDRDQRVSLVELAKFLATKQAVR